MTAPSIGSLTWLPATERPELLGGPVAAALSLLPGPVWVAEIDDDLADTAAFSEAYAVPLEVSANCVVVAARRAGQTTLAACVVLATTRADVNGLVRRHLGARKASFAPQDVAVAESGMAYGGITPVGLPRDWPVLLDPAVEASDFVVIGSGIRGSKLAVSGSLLAALPAAEVLEGLGQPLADPPPPPSAGPVRARTGRCRCRLGRAARRARRRRPALPGGPPAALGQRLTSQSRPGSVVVPGPDGSCPGRMPCWARSRSRISRSSSTWVGSAGPASSPRLRRSMIAFIGSTTTK